VLAPPPSASARRYLQNGLPAIYQDADSFGLRFLSGLETVLDTVVTLLDCLYAHVDPRIAPKDLLGLMAAWLGLDLDEAWPEERWRQLVCNAGTLSRTRGTRAGFELELRIAFPEVPLRVEDEGGVIFANDPHKVPSPPKGGFVIYCDVPLADDDAAMLAHAIEQMKPVDVPFRLKIKSARKTAREPQE
jgi:phage tail-like protein